MKLQGTHFNIKKISYPNSDTRHGKIKADLLQEFPVPSIFSIQIVKECAQAMAHEHFLVSHIRQYRHWRNLSPEDPNILIEIFLNQREKEGTGIVYKLEAAAFKLGKPDFKYFEMCAELSPIK